MKKIGILRCAHANEVCTGAGCLNAFFRRTDRVFPAGNHLPNDGREGHRDCKGYAPGIAEERSASAPRLFFSPVFFLQGKTAPLHLVYSSDNHKCLRIHPHDELI